MDEDDIWLVPANHEEESGGTERDGCTPQTEKCEKLAQERERIYRLRRNHLQSASSNDQPVLLDLSRLNFDRRESEVMLDEFKTHSCLLLILEDAQHLLRTWDSTMQHPAYKRYLVDTEKEEQEERSMRMIDLGERGIQHNRRVDSILDKMTRQEQNVVLCAKNFNRVFKDSGKFEQVFQSVNGAKGMVMEKILPVLNGFIPEEQKPLPLEPWKKIWSFLQVYNRKIGRRLKLKGNVAEGDEAVLEDEAITDAFVAAASLNLTIMDILSNLGNTSRRELKIVDKLDSLHYKCSILKDLLNKNNDDVEVSSTSSMLRKGHYTVKQVCVMSHLAAGEGKNVCGHSSKFLVTERGYGNKTVLTLWNSVRRNVACTASVARLGCDTLVTFVFQKQLFVIMLSKPEAGNFFVYIMRREIDPNAASQKFDTNSWPHPVAVREVATDGLCKSAPSCHMFEDESDGALTCLVIFCDDEGTKVAFFDPYTGVEMSWDNLDQNCLKLEDVKDSKAVFSDRDSGTVAIYEFRKRSHLLAKIPLSTIFSGELKASWELGCSWWAVLIRAAFDQTDSSQLVLFSPDGQFTFYDIKSCKMGPKTKRRFELSWQPARNRLKKDLELQVHYSTNWDDPRMVEQDRLRSHCLVRGVLFFIVEKDSSLCLRAIDLNSNNDEEDVVYEVCRFRTEGQRLLYRQAGENEFEDTNLEDETARQIDHFVPYAFAKVFETGVNNQNRCDGVSYLWTLVKMAEYKLCYCEEADALHIIGQDKNFVEIKFLGKDSVWIKARHVAKQREVLAKWMKKESGAVP